MQASLEILGELKRQLKVQLPAKKFDSAYQQRLQSLAKSAKLDGFRKGKVPMKVIQQRYGGSVKEEILTDLIQRSFDQAVREEKLDVASPPRIDLEPAEPGQDISYTAHFEVLPEYKLADLSKIKVKKPSVKLSKNDIENTLEKLRQQQADWQMVERGAKQGDQIKINYEGSLSGGESFEGSSGRDVLIVLGEEQMPADFESRLEGIAQGEHRSVKITLSKDFHQESLQGQQAVYEIDCRQVSEKKLPKVDEAFAQLFGIEDGSIDALKDSIKLHLEKELAKNIRSNVNKQVLDGLIELHDIQLPEMLVETQIDQLQYEALQKLGLENKDMDRLPRKHFETHARYIVHMGIVGSRFIKEMQIKAKKEAVQGKIEEVVSDYENPEEMLNYYKNNQNALERFRLLAVEDQLVEEILKQAEVKEQEMTFDALIELNTQ